MFPYALQFRNPNLDNTVGPKQIPSLYSTSRSEHTVSLSTARQNNRVLRFTSHSVEHLRYHTPIFYLIDSYAKAVHNVHVSRICSFSSYSTAGPIFCSCLHGHRLKLKLQKVISVTGKNTNSSAELTKNYMMFLFLTAKRVNRTFHAVCSPDVRKATQQKELPLAIFICAV